MHAVRKTWLFSFNGKAAQIITWKFNHFCGWGWGWGWGIISLNLADLSQSYSMD